MSESRKSKKRVVYYPFYLEYKCTHCGQFYHTYRRAEKCYLSAIPGRDVITYTGIYPETPRIFERIKNAIIKGSRGGLPVKKLYLGRLEREDMGEESIKDFDYYGDRIIEFGLWDTIDVINVNAQSCVMVKL